MPLFLAYRPGWPSVLSSHAALDLSFQILFLEHTPGTPHTTFTLSA